MAPMLFNLAVEVAMKRASIKKTGTLVNDSYLILVYADDSIIGRSIKTVKEIFVNI